MLEASQAHAQNPAVLDIPQTIQTLSGVEAVVLEGEELKERLKDKKKLCMLPTHILETTSYT